ncbi:MAG: fibronectin type III domain-containing protein [Eubacteriales bacterium]|nr:fibronectin type III domain-containing protein [Eubacteriales bacterium]
MDELRRYVTKVTGLLLAFLLVFCMMGVPGKAYADSSTCHVTMKVIDDEDGTEIKDATPIVALYTYDGDKIMTPNADGSYDLEIEWNDGEDCWDNYYRFYASAKGYKDPNDYHARESLNDKGMTTDENGNKSLVVEYKLHKQSEEERLNEVRQKAKDEIKNYKSADEYEADEQTALQTILSEANDKIDAASADEEIAKAVTEAKAKIDQLVTIQSKANDRIGGSIRFRDPSGNITKAVGRDGNYEITVSLKQAGGVFYVDGQEVKSWKAEAQQFVQEGLATYHFIDPYDGSFADYEKAADGSFYGYKNAPYFPVKIEDAEVKLSDGTVATFTLNVVDRLITGVEATAPESVTLTRDEKTKEYNTTVALGSGADQLNVKVTSDDPDYTGGYSIESLTPEVAEYKEDQGIVAHKPGVADFKIVSKDDPEKTAFVSIEFLPTVEDQKAAEEEAKEAAAAAEVDQKIQKIGKVTISDKDAIQAARKAYDALTDSEKAKVKNYSVLQKAEQSFKKLKPSKVTIKSLKAGKKKAVLTFKKASRAEKYRIYLSSKKKGSYKLVKTVKSSKKTIVYTAKKLKKGRTYYFKVRAVNAAGSSSYSKIKSVKVK